MSKKNASVFVRSDQMLRLECGICQAHGFFLEPSGLFSSILYHDTPSSWRKQLYLRIHETASISASKADDREEVTRPGINETMISTE